MEAKQHNFVYEQIMEEIKKEIKICKETNENENTTTQNLWDSVTSNSSLKRKVHIAGK